MVQRFFQKEVAKKFVGNFSYLFITLLVNRDNVLICSLSFFVNSIIDSELGVLLSHLSGSLPEYCSLPLGTKN